MYAGNQHVAPESLSIIAFIYATRPRRMGSRANELMPGGVAALLQPLAVSSCLRCLILSVPGKLQPRDLVAIASLTVSVLTWR